MTPERGRPVTGMDERLAKVAELEFAHGGYKSAGVGEGWLCWCGERLSNWWPEGGVTPRDTALDYALRSHRVQAFAPLLAEWQAEDRAEALREAADKWQWGAWADAPRCADRVQERVANAQFVTDWLRGRVALASAPQQDGDGS